MKKAKRWSDLEQQTSSSLPVQLCVQLVQRTSCRHRVPNARPEHLCTFTRQVIARQSHVPPLTAFARRHNQLCCPLSNAFETATRAHRHQWRTGQNQKTGQTDRPALFRAPTTVVKKPSDAREWRSCTFNYLKIAFLYLQVRKNVQERKVKVNRNRNNK